MKNDYPLWYVGGAVRDFFYNQVSVYDKRKIKDIDIAFEGSYLEMYNYVKYEMKGSIVQQDEKFGRLLAGILVENLPSDPLVDAYLESNHKKTGGDNSKQAIYIDFVVTRSDGFYTDGRHPDSIALADINVDLSRRDFTMNAIAWNLDTNIILDPYSGREAIKKEIIAFVGNPIDRMLEDFLRILRAYRFKVTLSNKFNRAFRFDEVLQSLLSKQSDVIARGLSQVSNERIYEELMKMFRHDNHRAFMELVAMPKNISSVLLLDNPAINLIPTMKEM
jgi:tRNA nucleotidyltransferase/poly(A) polymerase